MISLLDERLEGGIWRKKSLISRQAELASAVAWNRRRMQNMILTVGPGTPAAVLYTNEESDHEDNNGNFDSDDDSDGSVGDMEDDDESSVVYLHGPERGEHQQNGGGDGSDDDDVDDDDDAGEEDTESGEGSRNSGVGHRNPMIFPLQLLRREWLHALRPETRSSSQQLACPSMRHGGCINTACWLDAPWRLSNRSGSISSPPSKDCPTQLLTSGDDKLVKVWDLSAAMGMDDVWSGGWNTYCPHSGRVTKDWKRKWQDMANARTRLHGTVVQLASLSTGHRGNVFHVTPLRSNPGNVLTCGADGNLRLCNFVASSSSLVVQPMEDDIPFLMHMMAFSHVMLSTQTGLLCSERGLHLFDLRLSPGEQQRKSLLPNETFNGVVVPVRSCKACAVWNPHSLSDDDMLDMQSNYVFTGGSHPTVSLLDLRMDGARSRVVERYRPDGLPPLGSGVSVSGLDVSKDSRELLVSYESDQIYTFPIADSIYLDPTIDHLESLCRTFENNKDASLPELSSYGGHLNRFTFLKNAKYAGPNDEYICTGSDSGHAWIYDRCSGTVVSLLGADSNTCNGVIPHPDLPFFVTYGIDSTAKLWRASPPVDPAIDDSTAARASHALKQPYDMNPVTRTWEGVQAMLRHMNDEPVVMPDYIAPSVEVQASGRFGSQRRSICIGNDDAPKLGNALETLPSILRQNRYECYKRTHDELDVPVDHPLPLFTHRVSISRLQHQADRLGLKWHPWTPWALTRLSSNERVHPADLVPDNPSDWINYDPQMRRNPMHPRKSFFATGDDEALPYHEYLLSVHVPGFFQSKDECQPTTIPWLVHRQPSTLLEKEGGDSAKTLSFEDRSRQLLYETALLLKEGGNEATKDGQLDQAARRYDKAIQYCAVAFMRYDEGRGALKHLTEGHYKTIFDAITRKKTCVIATWSPLLRVLITSRLNLALLFLKPGYVHAEWAATQARAALKLLAPFTVRPGKVVHLDELTERILKQDEPTSTFDEAQALKAKAYYRLGSAELESGDFASAVRMFDASLKCTAMISSSTSRQPDSLTIKRLQEAKRKQRASKNREKVKYQRLTRNNNDKKSKTNGST